MSTAHAFTSDFHEEFEAETSRLLRNRFLWLCATLAGLTVLFAAVIAVSMPYVRGGALPPNPDSTVSATLQSMRISLAMRAGDFAIYAAFFFIALSSKQTPRSLLGLTYWLVLIDGAVNIALGIVLPDHSAGVVGVVITHMLACAFLPWSPRQALRPTVILLGLNAFVVATQSAVLGEPVWWLAILGIAFTPLIAAPGLLIAWLRHSRRLESFKVRFLQSRYGMIRRELVDARRIHEDLFPKPVESGPVRFTYRYEPMLLIGGDYLYARFSPGPDGGRGALNIVLLDVTGHGIAAALTVNRLYGEIERLYAENPAARPGDVLHALNRYVHLTLAVHSVYATALCVRVDPRTDKLEYASGGHPPAFLRAADGTIEQLDSTSFVLGVAAGEDYDPAPNARTFGPGDALLAYTDGVIESRNDGGRTLGVRGLQRIVAGAFRGHRAWALGDASQAIFDAAAAHRSGPSTDDALVIEVVRDLTPGAAVPTEPALTARPTVPAAAAT